MACKLPKIQHWCKAASPDHARVVRRDGRPVGLTHVTKGNITGSERLRHSFTQNFSLMLSVQRIAQKVRYEIFMV